MVSVVMDSRLVSRASLKKTVNGALSTVIVQTELAVHVLVFAYLRNVTPIPIAPINAVKKALLWKPVRLKPRPVGGNAYRLPVTTISNAVMPL
jgi:hypothetical protein